jgi:anti-sigma regulatory factor (Ser/Thr protein kinase)
MEITSTCQEVPIQEASQPGEGRRVASAIARETGLTDEGAGRAALIAVELGTNLVKHAGGGLLLVNGIQAEGAMELLALDKGPGIDSKCLRDGYSTAGSSGYGLGVVRRQADLFDVYTAAGHGAAILARVGAASGGDGAGARLCVDGFSVPLAGEPVCGDNWGFMHRENGGTLLVADGLGHGVSAHEAAAEAVRLQFANRSARAAELVEILHTGLRGTRGAAVAVAEFDVERGIVRFAGLGNVGAVIVTGDLTRSAVSYNGTAGHEMRRLQEFQYPWGKDSVLVMHSDGISGRWQLQHWKGLQTRHPALIAGVLFRDHRRKRDDATVVVVRQGGWQSGPF